MISKIKYRRISDSFFLFFILLFPLHLFGTEKSNTSIIQEELKKASKQIISYLIESNADTIYTDIKIKEADRFFNSIFVDEAAGNKVAVFIDDIKEGKSPYLDISLIITTNYSNCDDYRDSLNRRIEIVYSGAIRHKTEQITALPLDDFIYENKISRSAAEKNNESDFEFARCEIPEEQSTFWDDVLQPITIIGAAAVTVVLLFTLRSN